MSRALDRSSHSGLWISSLPGQERLQRGRLQSGHQVMSAYLSGRQHPRQQTGLSWRGPSTAGCSSSTRSPTSSCLVATRHLPLPSLSSTAQPSPPRTKFNPASSIALRKTLLFFGPFFMSPSLGEYTHLTLRQCSPKVPDKELELTSSLRQVPK